MRLRALSRALRQWGATEAEAGGRQRGDELLNDDASTTTYAVTAQAGADRVWPWLAQLGQDRGGMYSYTWLENLFRLGIHNAEAIHPEWQRLTVGDQVRVVPRGKLGMPQGYAFRVAVVDPPHALVLRQHPPEHPWDATWAFLIIAEGPDCCRLISRSRSARLPGGRGVAARVGEALLQPVVLLMTRKMLLGIKRRAERTPLPTCASTPVRRTQEVTATGRLRSPAAADIRIKEPEGPGGPRVRSGCRD
jgi:hypothetical protein